MKTAVVVRRSPLQDFRVLVFSCLCSFLRQYSLPLTLLLFTTVDSCVLVSWVILLSVVALAFAGGHHSYLVGPGAAVLTLQPDPLGPGPVNDAAPLLGVTAAPVPTSVTSTPDPVGKQVSRQTLSSAHQLLDGVDTGALAIRDVLGGPQLPAANLALVWAWDMETELHICMLHLILMFHYLSSNSRVVHKFSSSLASFKPWVSWSTFYQSH